MITLTCPNCRFSAKLSREKIPPGVKWVKCPQCRHRFEITDMLLAPRASSTPIITNPDATGHRTVSPWEDRLERGFLRGLFQTFRAVLFSPKRLFHSMTTRQGIREPFAFGLLFGSLGYMFGLFWRFLLRPEKLPDYVQNLLAHISFDILFLVLLFVSPLIIMIMLLITSALAHFFLTIVRGSKGGFEGTFRVIAFAQAANAFGIIPYIGGFIGSIWYFVVVIIGLREIHGISYARVFFALLFPLGLMVFIGIMAVMASLTAMLQGL